MHLSVNKREHTIYFETFRKSIALKGSKNVLFKEVLKKYFSEITQKDLLFQKDGMVFDLWDSTASVSFWWSSERKGKGISLQKFEFLEISILIWVCVCVGGASVGGYHFRRFNVGKGNERVHTIPKRSERVGLYINILKCPENVSYQSRLFPKRSKRLLFQKDGTMFDLWDKASAIFSGGGAVRASASVFWNWIWSFLSYYRDMGRVRTFCVIPPSLSLTVSLTLIL